MTKNSQRPALLLNPDAQNDLKNVLSQILSRRFEDDVDIFWLFRLKVQAKLCRSEELKAKMRFFGLAREG